MSRTTYVDESGEIIEVKSNFLIGTLGAILGALLGAALWVVIYQFGYIASVAGFAIIFCSFKGYALFSKRSGRAAAVVAVIASVLMLCLAHAFCLGLDIYSQLGADYGLTLFDAMLLIPTILFDHEIISMDSSLIFGFFKDLLFGLILIAAGYFTCVRGEIKKNDKRTRGEA